MGLFDLVFIALFLISAASLGAAGVLALRGKRSAAWRLVKRWSAGAAIYLGIVVLVSAIAPRRVYRVGDPQCFDDWCIAVAKVDTRVGADGTDYAVDFKIWSRARRVAQRENGLRVYLCDGQGRRFEPVGEAAATPFNVLLQPRESAMVARVFTVPKDARDLGVVVTHAGGFPIGWFIIGYDTWFRKPPVVPLPTS